jgi:hypothetical protein
MIVAYLTEDYYRWGELFLKSFKKHNGIDYPIRFNTRNLNRSQAKTLKSIYPLQLVNKQLTIQGLSTKYNVPPEEIEESKKACAGIKSGKYRMWMNITADDDRINSLLSTIKDNPKEPSFVHMDVDFLFRGSIRDSILKKSEKHDVGLIVRKQRDQLDLSKVSLSDTGKNRDSIITIATVAIGNNGNGKKFVKEWVRWINKTPLKQRGGVKWGQFAIYKAFLRYQHDNSFNFWRIPYGEVNSNQSDGPHAKIWYFKGSNKGKEYQKAIQEFRK